MLLSPFREGNRGENERTSPSCASHGSSAFLAFGLREIDLPPLDPFIFDLRTDTVLTIRPCSTTSPTVRLSSSLIRKPLKHPSTNSA
jgi:hypothetical protein